jgi:hypothetical protein
MNTRKALLIVATTAGCGIGSLLAADRPLPWEREIPLREAARSVALTETLNPTSPLPSGEYFGGASMSINNLKMRTTLWGPPDRVTISINKNNVWDRRVAPRAFNAPTLQEVIDGANSPANKDYVGRAVTDQRPKEYGYLRKEAAAGSGVPALPFGGFGGGCGGSQTRAPAVFGLNQLQAGGV